MDASASVASALMRMFAGALKVEPFAGLVRLTLGGTLDTAGRSARMWVLPTSELAEAVERLAPLAAACTWSSYVPVIDWPMPPKPFARSYASVRPAWAIQFCAAA